MLLFHNIKLEKQLFLIVLTNNIMPNFCPLLIFANKNPDYVRPAIQFLNGLNWVS